METTRSLIASQCGGCIFKITGKLACVAFPRGIPREIAEARFDHTQPYAGDGGIRFAPLRSYGRQRAAVRDPGPPDPRSSFASPRSRDHRL